MPWRCERRFPCRRPLRGPRRLPRTTAAGAMGIFRRDARRRQCDRAFGIDQIVDALAALPVPALDQHCLAPERKQSPALAFDVGLVRRHRLIEQRGSFRQVRRDQRGARNDFGPQRFDRLAASKRSPEVATITGSSTMCCGDQRESPAAIASIVASCATMPILTAPTARSANTASICAVTKSAGTW